MCHYGLGFTKIGSHRRFLILITFFNEFSLYKFKEMMNQRERMVGRVNEIIVVN
jgi:hypothetical protein